MHVLYIWKLTWTWQSTGWQEEYWSIACTSPSTTQPWRFSLDSDPSPPTSRESRYLYRSLLPLMGHSLQHGSKSLEYTLTLQYSVYQTISIFMQALLFENNLYRSNSVYHLPTQTWNIVRFYHYILRSLFKRKQEHFFICKVINRQGIYMYMYM